MSGDDDDDDDSRAQARELAIENFTKLTSYVKISNKKTLLISFFFKGYATNETKLYYNTELQTRR